jgi:hypothetical protein
MRRSSGAGVRVRANLPSSRHRPCVARPHTECLSARDEHPARDATATWRQNVNQPLTRGERRSRVLGRCTGYALITACSCRGDKATRKCGANSANHEHVSYRSAWGRVSDNRDISRWPQRVHRRLSNRGRRSGVAGQLSTGAPAQRSAGRQAAPRISRYSISSASSAARHTRGGSPKDKRATRDNNLAGNSRNSPGGTPTHTRRKPG